jgi:hypothetical protein
VTNATGVTVIFFVDDVGAKPGTLAADGWRLEPAANAVDHRTIPSDASDGRRATVRALDTNGEVVFCRGFGFDQLKADQFPNTHYVIVE